MKILCVLGQHNYGNPARGAGYEYVNFLPALRKLGHEVLFFESFSRAAYKDFADLNRQLLQRVDAEKPDVVLCVLLGYEVWLETLQLIREGTDALLLNWSTDDSWKYEQFSRYIASAFDVYATTYPDAVEKAGRDGHGNFHLTQWAANSEKLLKPLPAAQCRYQVSFVGTCYGNRPKWVARLAEDGIGVDCFGFGWPRGPVAAETIPQIIQNSIISLNFGDSGLQWRGLLPMRSRQIKARIFEVPGAGGFLVTELAPGLQRFYVDSKELVTFKDYADLVQKIQFYLQEHAQRDAIAQAGYRRTADAHCYEERFSVLLDAAVSNQLSHADRDRAGKSANGIDLARFSLLERQHQAGPILRMFAALLRWSFCLFWGQTRGPRAARRLLFEISWRVVGKKTYSASGWPGRLFYLES